MCIAWSGWRAAAEVLGSLLMVALLNQVSDWRVQALLGPLGDKIKDYFLGCPIEMDQARARRSLIIQRSGYQKHRSTAIVNAGLIEAILPIFHP